MTENPRVSDAFDEIGIAQCQRRKDQEQTRRWRSALRATSEAELFRSPGDQRSYCDGWVPYWVRAAKKVRLIGLRRVPEQVYRGFPVAKIAAALFDTLLDDPESTTFAAALCEECSNLDHVGCDWLQMKLLFHFLSRHLMAQMLRPRLNPTNLSPSENRVFRALHDRTPAFCSAKDVEQAFRGKTKASAIISRLKSKGVPVESASTARELGKTVSEESVGYRIVVPIPPS